MTITDIVHDTTTDWGRQSPASEAVLSNLALEAGCILPNDYLNFLSHSNGGEGELGVQPGWFQLWEAENVIQFGVDYEVPKYAPGFFAFGSNGGGEILAFDIRNDAGRPIVALPCIGLEPDEAMLVAANFADFAAQMGRTFKE